MNIKIIAVDMDGTFLNKESTYDKKRFALLYEQLKQRGIRFVVASGNPLNQLQGTFENIQHELIYISENGGYIVEGTTELYLSNLSIQDTQVIIEKLKEMPDVLCWACTKNQSYTLHSIPESYFQMFLPYFPGVKKLEDFSMIQEPMIKFALYLPQRNVEERMADFSSFVSDQVRVVDSGHDCVDLIPTHTNKGSAMEFLMKRYQIQRDEVMAFGDAGNDEELLKLAGYGYAMDNAKEAFKDNFDYIAPSNQEQGVLTVIEQYLRDGTFLNLK